MAACSLELLYDHHEGETGGHMYGWIYSLALYAEDAVSISKILNGIHVSQDNVMKEMLIT